MKLDWIADQLNMGNGAEVWRLVGEVGERLATDRALRREVDAISKERNIKWLIPFLLLRSDSGSGYYNIEGQPSW
jgi:hypothetical protein